MTSTSMNIFAPSRPQKRKNNLVEFRAGKMKIENNNWVYPDTRKGMVFIHQTSDGLMHFCWKDRSTGNIEDDLIVFPNETIFKRLPECKTGRVYLLRFKDAKKIFLWMQEPREEKDTELCRMVNDILNNKLSESQTDPNKPLNLNQFTDLLGELHGIGALNDMDIIEILAHGLGSQISAETEFPIQPTMNPFPIGNPPPVSNTFNPLNETNQVPPAISFRSSQKDSITTVNFRQSTLKELAKNSKFCSTFLKQSKQTSNNEEIDCKSKEFKDAVLKFQNELQTETSATNIIREMGLPISLIVKNDIGELIEIAKAIDDYYESLDNQKKKKSD